MFPSPLPQNKKKVARCHATFFPDGKIFTLPAILPKGQKGSGREGSGSAFSKDLIIKPKEVIIRGQTGAADSGTIIIIGDESHE